MMVVSLVPEWGSVMPRVEATLKNYEIRTIGIGWIKSSVPDTYSITKYDRLEQLICCGYQ